MKRTVCFSWLLVISLGILSCSSVMAQPGHWDYDHPASWQTEGYPDCGLTEQSPININTMKVVKDYMLPEITPTYADFLMKIIDNGHTIQVNIPPGSTLNYDGKVYTLKQFHFHRHSENQIDGETFSMEIHLVHADPTGKLLVIGVMLEAEDSHKDNPFIQKVWGALPTKKLEEQTTTVTLNMNEILPADKSYYTFAGSLTTPPCSEGVTWVVMKEIVPISNAQADTFDRIYSDNARPVQKTNKRIVKVR